MATISKNDKTGKWDIQFWYKDWQGVRRHKTKCGFALKRDAEQWHKSFLATTHNENITLGQLIEEYKKSLDVSYKLGNIKESTLDTKKTYLRLYILPYFENIKASKIKTKDINNWLSEINNIPENKNAEKSRYTKYVPYNERKTKRSSSTINAARSELSQVFEFGIKNFGLLENPVLKSERVKFYSNDKRDKYWTVEQYKIFYDSLENEAYRVFYNVLYWAGLRIGEALALTPADIKRYKIIVNKAIVHLHDGTEILDTPKTKTSVREIEITRPLYFQIKNYIKTLYGIKNSDKIFNLNQGTIRLKLADAAVKLGLPKISPHILRHSYASNLYTLSKNITVVSKQIGHSNSNVTLKVYTHMTPEQDRQTIDQLETLQITSATQAEDDPKSKEK